MKSAVVALGITAGLAASCSSHTETTREWLPVHAGAGEPPVLSLRVHPSNKLYLVGERPGLIVAAWSDGRVVFSGNTTKGGGTLFERRVDPAEVRSAHAQALQTARSMTRRSYTYSDGAYTEVYIADARGPLVLSSVHEIDPSGNPYRDPGEWADFQRDWREATDPIRGLLGAPDPANRCESVRLELVTLPVER